MDSAPNKHGFVIIFHDFNHLSRNRQKDKHHKQRNRNEGTLVERLFIVWFHILFLNNSTFKITILLRLQNHRCTVLQKIYKLLKDWIISGICIEKRMVILLQLWKTDGKNKYGLHDSANIKSIFSYPFRIIYAQANTNTML